MDDSPAGLDWFPLEMNSRMVRFAGRAQIQIRAIFFR